MEGTSRFIIALCLVSFCRGLDLTLNHDVSVVTGTRAFCGVLTCEEDTDDAVSSMLDNDQVSSSVSLKSISSMSVFKKVPASSRSGGKGKQEFLLASVTSQNPSITRVANGIKLKGLLKAERATMRLELFKHEDCQAEFTCKVHGVDTSGRDVVSTTSLLQQQDQRGNQVDDGSLVPAMSLQLLASVQQLVTQSVKGLEDKIGQLQGDVSKQSGLEDKIEKFQRDFNDRSHAFERRIEDRLLLFENRVEDKIDNNNNLNKLVQLDVKTSTELAQFRSEAKADILSSLDDLRQSVQIEQTRAMRSVSDGFEKKLNVTYDLLSSIENDVDLLKSNAQTNLVTVRNETETIRDMLASGDALSRRVSNDVKELKSSLYNCTTNTRSELDSEPESSDLGSLFMDILTPKFCRKGMGFALTHRPSPYIRINPVQNSADSIDFPHVCDAVTDGGGWIVIQRRATGNTDFYRNWTDYKQGFGSFDDDFWIGNDKIHAITSTGPYELRVDLRYNGKHAFAHYGEFSVAAESDKYRLRLKQFDGTAGDSLGYHSGKVFSTPDRDNDEWQKNCAVEHGGAWWFGACDHSNLNGKWGSSPENGVEWEDLAGPNSVSYSEMKIRQV